MLHGLLYVAQSPLTVEEMCELLQLARSNVSTSLKELEGYNLIYRESRAGDRRSFYRAESDVWEMARRILEERRRRETAGAVQAVEECLDAAREAGDEHTAARMEAMQELLQTAENVATAAQRYNTSVFPTRCTHEQQGSCTYRQNSAHLRHAQALLGRPEGCS
jgi:DNA-binding transcriptional regulator GbsR (MarR family)